MTEPTPTWGETAEEVMAEKHSLLQRLGRADTTELFPDARDAQVTRLTARGTS